MTNIFTTWNNFGIIKHKKITPIIEKTIRKALGNYSEEEIIKGIQNYSEIVKSNRTWFNYKWTIAEFLKRDNGLSVFLYKTVADYGDDKIGGTQIETKKTDNNYLDGL